MIDRRALIVGGMSAAALTAALADERSPPRNQTIELRQYTLFAGKRDRLIELFEREFIVPQNEVGAQVLGAFTDLGDPDRFVWLRGFRNMEARGSALPAFYNGPVWQRHRDAANETMRDSDNVLLLRLLSGRLEPTSPSDAGAFYSIWIYYLRRTDSERFAEFFEETMRPALAASGIDLLATLATERQPNNYPRLPIREGEEVFVQVASHRSLAHMQASEERLRSLSGWRDRAPDDILPTLMRKPEHLRLAPTFRAASG